MKTKIITIQSLFVLIGLPLLLSAQDTKIERLKQLYKQERFQACYEQVEKIENPSPEDHLLKALSFYQLPDSHEKKKDTDKPLLSTLQQIQEAKKNLNQAEISDPSFFLNELKTLQTVIFEKAKKWHENGLNKKAREYFDEFHKTFDNTKNIFKNHYGFDDSYFVNILQQDIEIPEEYYSYYKEKYDLMEKYYHSVDKFKEWNNPIYRLANTARDVDYENEDEKMVFYFLNLARMNPELYLETFVKTRLHIRYHSNLELQVPVFDSLNINQYSQNLTFDEFMKLPVHKLYNQDLPKETIERFVKTTVVDKTPQSTRYRYDINYGKFYEYLKKNKSSLLDIRNLSNYKKTEDGREIILFKLYDKKYTIYDKNYKEQVSDHYHQSLFKKLKEMKPLSLIHHNQKLFELAECWAVEAGKRELKGHDRVNCPYGYDSECCDYGNKNGFDVVLSLLIDRYVPDLGHRKTLLGHYQEMGVAIRPHKGIYKYNAVLDFFR